MQLDDATLLDISNAARLTQDFSRGMDRDAFLADLKTQSAVMHQLLILGEAVKRLSDAFRASHPELPWQMMTGMRDILIHHYDGVDIDEVWNTVTNDLPKLIQVIEPLIPEKKDPQ